MRVLDQGNEVKSSRSNAHEEGWRIMEKSCVPMRGQGKGGWEGAVSWPQKGRTDGVNSSIFFRS